MRIAIIGSNSFIASYVIEELHNRGHEVVGLQRHLPSVEKQIYNADEIYLGDITSAEVVERIVSISDHVINLAGILGTSETVNNPLPAVKVNIEGTLNVLNACRIWEKPFLQIAVGNFFELSTYSITRTTAEKFVLMYAKEHKIKANVVRALNAFGARQSYSSYKKIMPSFILNALHNKPLGIYGTGKQFMDFIYVSDIAYNLVECLLNPEQYHEKTVGIVKEQAPQLLGKDIFEDRIYGNTYQAGEGRGFEVLEIAQKILDKVGGDSKLEFKPMRQGESAKAVVVADYKAPFYSVDMDKGLDLTIQWYKDNISKYTV